MIESLADALTDRLLVLLDLVCSAKGQSSSGDLKGRSKQREESQLTKSTLLILAVEDAPPASTRLARAATPATDLIIVVLTDATPPEEATIPLEPSSSVMLGYDPSSLREGE